MPNRRTSIAALVLCVPIAACVDRPANTVATQQSFDGAMTCKQIAAEYAANNQMLANLAGDSRARDDQNALAVGGVLLTGVAGLSAIDAGEAERAEVASYRQRNQRLTELATMRGCPPLVNAPQETTQAD